jgi:hypothetical protein
MDTTLRKHWTETEMWRESKTGETIPAGELIKRNERYFRLNRMPSLCNATFSVRAEDNSTWNRVR